jgi:hypothetical protein
VVARGGVVAWRDVGTNDAVTIYDLATGTYTSHVHVGQDYEPIALSDVAPFDGELHAYFSASTYDFGIYAYTTLYDWDVTTDVTTLFANNANGGFSDGARVAWDGGPALYARSLANGTDALLSSGYASRAVAADGLIAWYVRDYRYAPNIGVADSDGNIRLLVRQLNGFDDSVQLNGTAGGFVAFSDPDGLKTFDDAADTTTLQLPFAANQALITTGALYFTAGIDNDVYKAPLH